MGVNPFTKEPMQFAANQPARSLRRGLSKRQKDAVLTFTVEDQKKCFDPPWANQPYIRPGRRTALSCPPLWITCGGPTPFL